METVLESVSWPCPRCHYIWQTHPCLFRCTHDQKPVKHQRCGVGGDAVMGSRVSGSHKEKEEWLWMTPKCSVKCVLYSLLCGGSDLCGEKSGRRQPGKSLPASVVPHTAVRTASIHIFMAVVLQFWDGLLKREAVMLIRTTDWMRSLKFSVTKTGGSTGTAVQVASMNEPFPL